MAAAPDSSRAVHDGSSRARDGYTPVPAAQQQQPSMRSPSQARRAGEGMTGPSIQKLSPLTARNGSQSIIGMPDQTARSRAPVRSSKWRCRGHGDARQMRSICWAIMDVSPAEHGRCITNGRHMVEQRRPATRPAVLGPARNGRLGCPDPPPDHAASALGRPLGAQAERPVGPRSSLLQPRRTAIIGGGTFASTSRDRLDPSAPQARAAIPTRGGKRR